MQEIKLKNNQLKKKSNLNKITKLLLIIGIAFLTGSLILFLLIYFPVIIQEIKFAINPGTNNTLVLSIKDSSAISVIKKDIVHPVDENYSIVIPKINANSKVIKNVNPFDEKEYQQQLTKGVAHAQNTALPGQPGNVFIFAHSAANWYQANRYNAVFYLLTKLQKKDDVYIFYKNNKFKYIVTDKKLTDSSALKYLHQDMTQKKLTLMTCWPPGTTLKRLIVTAELIDTPEL